MVNHKSQLQNLASRINKERPEFYGIYSNTGFKFSVDINQNDRHVINMFENLKAKMTAYGAQHGLKIYISFYGYSRDPEWSTRIWSFDKYSTKCHNFPGERRRFKIISVDVFDYMGTSKRGYHYGVNVSLSTTVEYSRTNAPCRDGDCRVCDKLLHSGIVSSSDGNREYRVPVHFTCQARNVIYLISCYQCGNFNQYVGQTGERIVDRFKNHLSDVKLGRQSVGLHYSQEGHSEDDMRIQVLQFFRLKPWMINQPWAPRFDRKRTEDRWMLKLGTIKPRGLNFDTNENIQQRIQRNGYYYPEY